MFKAVLCGIFFCVLHSSVYSNQILIATKVGQYKYGTAAGGMTVGVLLPEGIEGELNSKKFKEIRDVYIDGVEAKLKSMNVAGGDFFTWLQGNAELREALLVAIDPVYDNVANVCSILNDLRIKHPKEVAKYFHLAIAVAIVWDDEDAITTSRFRSIWGFSNTQFPKHRSALEVFEFFTSPVALKVALFKPDELRWPLLVHVVDYDVTSDESKWAINNYYKKRKHMGRAYSDIKYDHPKLISRRPSIGTRDYTLENIKKYNGICGDQAHYTSRISKTFGIPSMKVNGQGRYGGHHAWAGFLKVKKSVPLLDFTGRFLGDMFYTGKIFDPQKRYLVLDRSVQHTFLTFLSTNS